MDRKTGEAWWQYGAQQESTEEIERKRMSTDRLTEVVSQLCEWKLV
ncbi:hypothetical protein ACQP1G_22135 [Nocardia sp. CA-107356]